MTRSSMMTFPFVHFMQRDFIHDLATHFKVLVPFVPVFFLFWLLKDADNRVNRWIRSRRRKYQVGYGFRR